MSTLRDEIKQSKPFASLEQEAFLNLQRTADEQMAALAAELKPAELSPTQYNVLRILRGASAKSCEHGGSLACGEIADRMVTRDPDMTRLLDRLEKRGLVSRVRCPNDRRVVRTRITPEGMALVQQVDQPLKDLLKRQLGHLGEARLRQLIALLEDVRSANG